MHTGPNFVLVYQQKIIAHKAATLQFDLPTAYITISIIVFPSNDLNINVKFILNSFWTHEVRTWSEYEI